MDDQSQITQNIRQQMTEFYTTANNSPPTSNVHAFFDALLDQITSSLLKKPHEFVQPPIKITSAMNRDQLLAMAFASLLIHGQGLTISWLFDGFKEFTKNTLIYRVRGCVIYHHDASIKYEDQTRLTVLNPATLHVNQIIVNCMDSKVDIIPEWGPDYVPDIIYVNDYETLSPNDLANAIRPFEANYSTYIHAPRQDTEESRK